MPEIEEENQGSEVSMILEDPLPICPSCGGNVIFTGNERPDGRWIKTWKHWFKCLKCGIAFHENSDRGFRVLFSTRR